jgi:hypothetical protein
MEEGGVKVEQQDGEAAVKEEGRVKVEEREEREEPTGATSAEVPMLPTFASWNLLLGDYPYYFDGYMIRPCPPVSHTLFLV